MEQPFHYSLKTVEPDEQLFDRKRRKTNEIRTLILKNLPKFATPEDIMQIIPENALVQQIVLARDEEADTCLGYGFVEFQTRGHAENAFELMQGVRYPNKSRLLELDWAPQSSFPAMQVYQVYVGNLPLDWSDKKMLNEIRLFSPNVASAKVMTEISTGKSRGYGFLRYANGEAAKEAVDLLASKINKKSAYPQPLKLRLIDRKGLEEVDDGTELSPILTLHVNNLSPDTTETDLKEVFASFGKLQAVRFLYMRQQAYVTFHEHLAAVAAHSHLQETMLRDHPMSITWSHVQKNINFKVRLDQQAPPAKIDNEESYSIDYHNSMLPTDCGSQPAAKIDSDAPPTMETETRKFWLRCIAKEHDSSADSESDHD